MDVLFKIESMETFAQVLEEVLDNLFDSNHIVSNTILDVSNIKAVKEEIQNIILDTNLNTNEVNEVLLQTFHNDDDKIKIFVSLLEKKKSDLLKSTIVHYNCTFGETLNSFNWKLKLVCGTSELKTLSYPLLQLALYTVTTNHKQRLRLHEFNKEMLLKLIGTLEHVVGDKAVNEINQSSVNNDYD